MQDKKQRFYRLLETYMNDMKKETVESIYGVGSRIKIHNWWHNMKGDEFIFELVVILGDTINESVIEESLAEVLLEDALVYFYPEVKRVRCMVRFDV